MAKGGTITKRKEGVFDVELYTGFNPITKKYERRTKRVHGSKQDAINELDNMRRQQKTGLRSDANKVTFGEYSALWYERGKQSGNWAPSTVKRYKTMLKALNEYLAPVLLFKIDPQTVDSLYMALKNRGLSNTTIQKHHTLLKQILHQAMLYDLILRNPCDRVKPPRKDKVERKALSSTEIKQLLACLIEAEQHAYHANEEKEARQAERGNLFGRSYLMDLSEISRIMGARIGLSTGARRGEVLGLTWQHIDLEAQQLTIAQSVEASGTVKEPKTQAGIRTLGIDNQLAETLATWKEYQAAQLLKVGVKVLGSTPIVCDAKGGYMNPANFYHWWCKFTAQNGFEGLKFHELRHTQATVLIAKGTDIKTVQTRLGHASASVTLNMYAHATPANDRQAAETLGKLFGEGQETARIIDVKTA